MVKGGDLSLNAADSRLSILHSDIVRQRYYPGNIGEWMLCESPVQSQLLQSRHQLTGS